MLFYSRVDAPELKVLRVSLGNVLDYCALSLETMAQFPQA
jgi:hypothetical protein